MSDQQIVFSAFVLPDAMKREIISARNRVLEDNGIRPNGFEREEKLHITIKYFGEVRQSALHSIFQATERVMGLQPFEIFFDGFSVIYKRNIPKVLYARVTLPKPAFSLVTELEQEYSAIGFGNDAGKPFLPHITIKRIRMNGDERFIQCFPEEFESPRPFVIDTIAVFECIRTDKGSTYKYLKTYNLEG